MYPWLQGREKIDKMREDVLSILPLFFGLQSRVPDAAQRAFAVHRRAGTHLDMWMDPSPAAHGATN